MLKIISVAAAWLIAGGALAQSTATPTVAPETSETRSPPAIVGLSPCENLIGLERESCLKKERARTANAGGGAAGAGGTLAPAQNTAPSASAR